MGLLAKKLSEESGQPRAAEDRCGTGAATGMQRVAGQHDPTRQLGLAAPLSSPGAVFIVIVRIGGRDQDSADRRCDEDHAEFVHTSSMMRLARAVLVPPEYIAGVSADTSVPDPRCERYESPKT